MQASQVENDMTRIRCIETREFRILEQKKKERKKE